MSDRELRDEVEALFGALKRERQKTEAPLEPELAAARAALTTELAALTARAQALRQKIVTLGTLRETRQNETSTAKAELAAARAEISRREPLGNPLTESRSNWEIGEPGCAVGAWVVLSVALSAMGWWLR